MGTFAEAMKDGLATASKAQTVESVEAGPEAVGEGASCEGELIRCPIEM